MARIRLAFSIIPYPAGSSLRPTITDNSRASTLSEKTRENIGENFTHFKQAALS
jgi:hypothetical protein